MEKDRRAICLTEKRQPAAICGPHACDSITLSLDGPGCRKGIDIYSLNNELSPCTEASVGTIPGRASVSGFEPRVDTAG